MGGTLLIYNDLNDWNGEPDLIQRALLLRVHGGSSTRPSDRIDLVNEDDGRSRIRRLQISEDRAQGDNRQRSEGGRKGG